MRLIDAEILYDEIQSWRDVYAKRIEDGSNRDSDLFRLSAFDQVLSIIRNQKIYDISTADEEDNKVVQE